MVSGSVVEVDSLYEIDRLQPDDRCEIARVAARMRMTLSEVVGCEHRNMYSASWLVNRVEFHLGSDSRAVWLARTGSSRKSIGHLIARMEEDQRDGSPVALMSTIYVTPAIRGNGVATLLLNRFETWAKRQSALILATNTAEDNHVLSKALQHRGFEIVLHDPELKMVRLERRS